MKNNQKQYRKYKDFKCTECGAEKRVRVDYTPKTTLCRKCINEAQKGRHEYYGTRIYYCWQNMKQRCGRPGATGYDKYGAKGISVCEEWQDFKTFLKWALKNGYDDNLTIDRINGSGNYEPSNCRWATYATQSANTKQIHKTNKSGHRGVCRSGDKWRAYIQVNKKSIHLGVFHTLYVASVARDAYVINNNLGHTLNNKA